MQSLKLKRWGGVIIGGGKARRLGGRNKGQLTIDTRTLQEIALSHLTPKFDAIALSVGTEACAEIGDNHGYPQLIDRIINGQPIGPAGGLLAALDWATAENLAGIISLPVDTPILPDDLCTKLIAQDGSAYAMHDGDSHWLHAAWPITIKPAIEAAILQDQTYALHRLHKRIRSTAVDFSHAPDGAFHNINTPEDLDVAKQHFAG